MQDLKYRFNVLQKKTEPLTVREVKGGSGKSFWKDVALCSQIGHIFILKAFFFVSGCFSSQALLTAVIMSQRFFKQKEEIRFDCHRPFIAPLCRVDGGRRRSDRRSDERNLAALSQQQRRRRLDGLLVYHQYDNDGCCRFVFL